jgi:hypothetical protein
MHISFKLSHRTLQLNENLAHDSQSAETSLKKIIIFKKMFFAYLDRNVLLFRSVKSKYSISTWVTVKKVFFDTN